MTDGSVEAGTEEPTADQPDFLNPLGPGPLAETEIAPTERPTERSAAADTADQPPRLVGGSDTGAKPPPEGAAGLIKG